MEATTDLRM
jgi:hypothetical protein